MSCCVPLFPSIMCVETKNQRGFKAPKGLLQSQLHPPSFNCLKTEGGYPEFKPQQHKEKKKKAKGQQNMVGTGAKSHLACLSTVSSLTLGSASAWHTPLLAQLAWHTLPFTCASKACWVPITYIRSQVWSNLSMSTDQEGKMIWLQPRVEAFLSQNKNSARSFVLHWRALHCILSLSGWRILFLF